MGPTVDEDTTRATSDGAASVERIHLARLTATFTAEASASARPSLPSQPREPASVCEATRRLNAPQQQILQNGTATMMLEAGETAPTVAEYLGHATPVVTMTIYAHAVPGST
jgi:integrase